MTKSERETATLIREHINNALKYLESGRVGEGVDGLRTVKQLADRLTKSSKEM